MDVGVRCGCGKGFADEGWGERAPPWKLYVTKGHLTFKGKRRACLPPSPFQGRTCPGLVMKRGHRDGEMDPWEQGLA